MSANPSDSDKDGINVDELVTRMKQFGIIDYAIFIAMLIASSIIGLYFGVRDKQKNGKTKRRRDSIELNYLVGGRKMKIFPIAMSLAASMVSGVSLIGFPSEIYTHGTQFAFFTIPIVISSFLIHYMFIPVYMDLKLTSLYEYLEARFDRKMRYLGAFMFVFRNIFSMPIILYATALVFNQVSGINIHIVTPITCLVCIFYTTLGGMKAVVWTDALQTIIMGVILILIVVKGTLAIGGFDVVWSRNYESGRIELPSFTLDPTVRHSFLAIFIGGTFHASHSMSINQMYIQRFISLPSTNAARKALWLFIITVVILFSLCFYNGLLIYATYYDCDPVTTQLAKSKDQLLPVLVLNVLNNLPGIPGLFISGIFSASLSTLSTTLNSLSAVILQDFVKTFTKKPLTKFTTNLVMRGVVLIAGIICVGLVFVVEKFGALFQLKMTVDSCMSGPFFGVFLIGLLLPWINSNSALFGGVFSLIVMIWLAVNSQMALLRKELVSEQKPISTLGCTYNYTTVFSEPIIRTEPISPQIYHISYMWFVLIGTSMTIIVSGLATFVFGRQNPNNVDPSLLAPFVRKYFKNKDHEMVKIEKSELNDDTSSMLKKPHEILSSPNDSLIKS